MPDPRPDAVSRLVDAYDSAETEEQILAAELRLRTFLRRWCNNKRLRMPSGHVFSLNRLGRVKCHWPDPAPALKLCRSDDERD